MARSRNLPLLVDGSGLNIISQQPELVQVRRSQSSRLLQLDTQPSAVEQENLFVICFLAFGLLSSPQQCSLAHNLRENEFVHALGALHAGIVIGLQFTSGEDLKSYME